MADAWVNLATKSTSDTVAAADPNTLMENIRVVGGNGTSAPSSDIETLSTANNYIINGAMQVAQEQTTVNLTGTQDDYVCDNFKFSQLLSAGECTVSQSTEAPDGFYYSSKVDITQIDASIAIGEFAHFTAFVEGFNYASIKDKEVTRGFWVRSAKTGTFCVSVMNNGSDRSYVSDITISVADTWEYKTVTITLDQTVGTEDYTTGIGIQLLFTLACGSTFQTTADAWQTGEFYASANQDNWFDHVDNDFYITGAQLNLGSTALPFQHEDIATVLAKCQRYYEITTFDILSPVNALNDVIGGWCFYVVTKRTDVAPAFSAHSGTAVGVAQNVIHNIYGCQVYYFATGANVAAEGRDTVTTDARF